jgi:beta-glucosidase
MSSAFTDAVARVRAGDDHHAVARGLVEQMTLEEQLGCLDGDTPFWPGLFDMTSGGYYRHTWPAAHVPRLGVPGIDFADGPRGCVVGDATAFPVSMARGATFDPDLEERIGEVIGSELRASGATYTGAVCMNLLRHPAWGRAQETYGEDPLQVGVMAAAFTRGLQRHVMACMKHFALNSMENARFTVDVTVDERALHEVYLPHFERVAGEGVASVMSAYNSVNGHWCGENATLLTDILRDEWGWDGFVTSDFIFGLRDAVTSVRAGLDIEMPFRQQRAMWLTDALESGELDRVTVEAAVERIVATLLRFAYVFESQPPLSIVGNDDHRALACEAAVASMVLVRNDGRLLPVDPLGVGRVAVLGRLAAMRNLGDGGSSDVRASNVVTPLEGIRQAFVDAEVVHGDADASIVDGADLVVVVVGYTKDDEGEYIDDEGTGVIVADLFPPMDHPELGIEAPYVAPEASGRVAAVASGGSGRPAGSDDARMAPGGDCVSLRLSNADESLIAAAAARHDRAVVGVVAGSAVVMPWVETVRATIMTWYSGVEGGTALGEVLTGRAEPGGRLPFAVPTDPDHLVEFDRTATTATYDLFHGQWKLDRDGRAAHFPFGWGLGYASATVSAADLAADGDSARVRVANSSSRDTSTVVFVHAGLDGSAFERPRRRLVGFARVAVPAGTEVDVEVALDWSALDLRLDGAWVTEPGEYTLEVGQHAHDPAARSLTVERG